LAKGRKKKVVGEKQTLRNIAVLRDRGKETNRRIFSTVYRGETRKISKWNSFNLTKQVSFIHSLSNSVV
jgi:hypothetical protein